MLLSRLELIGDRFKSYADKETLNKVKSFKNSKPNGVPELNQNTIEPRTFINLDRKKVQGGLKSTKYPAVHRLPTPPK